MNKPRDFIVWPTGKWDTFHRRLPLLLLRQRLRAEDRILVVNRPWDPSRPLRNQGYWEPLFSSEKGLDIFTPRLPLHDHLSYRHPLWAQLNLAVFRSQLSPWLRDDALICHWVMHPVFYPFLSAFPPGFLLYDCYDEYTETPGQKTPRLIKQYEDILLRRADYTMVASDVVYQRKKSRARYLERVPNPTDLSLFFKARSADLKVPEDMAALPGLKAVYIGGLKPAFDQPLLAQLADTFPEVSWVLLGRPEGANMTALAERPNVHLLGYRPLSEIPAYLKGAHIGLIPYTIDPYTSMLQPYKAVEYLAAGLGVLSSAIPGLQELFPQEIQFYTCISDAVEQVRGLLAAPRLNLPSKCLAAYDWQAYLEKIEQKIQQKYP